MDAQIEYVREQLNNQAFNISAVSRATYISRPTLIKVKRGKQVSPKIIVALDNYFKGLL